MSNPVLAAGSRIPALPVWVTHPPPDVLLEVSPWGMWQPVTPPQAAARGDGSSVLPALKRTVPAESRASPRHPERWDPALSQGDVSPAAMFPLVIPPRPFVPTS